MQVRLRGIQTVKRRLADGTMSVHYYHRSTRKKLEGAPGSPLFLQSYAAAEKDQTNRLGETLAGLVRKYESSSDFSGTAETTQREYTRLFRVIDRHWGSCPMQALTDREFRRDVLSWHDKIAAGTPREADALVSAIARVLAFGVDRGEIQTNVLGNFRRAYKANRTNKIWLPTHIDAFCKVATAELVAALTLALHTGQRQGDLLRLRWSDYDGKSISLRQSKTGVPVTIPCTKALRSLLDGMAKTADTILTTPSGLTWTSYYFRHKWIAAAKAAGIKELHFHDLRGTAVTLLAEAGATVPEIAAITGHKLEYVGRILETYLARTGTLSNSAIAKLELHFQKTSS